MGYTRLVHVPDRSRPGQPYEVRVALFGGKRIAQQHRHETPEGSPEGDVQTEATNTHSYKITATDATIVTIIAVHIVAQNSTKSEGAKQQK
jgi:hypothetical protein